MIDQIRRIEYIIKQQNEADHAINNAIPLRERTNIMLKDVPHKGQSISESGKLDQL